MLSIRLRRTATAFTVMAVCIASYAEMGIVEEGTQQSEPVQEAVEQETTGENTTRKPITTIDMEAIEQTEQGTVTEQQPETTEPAVIPQTGTMESVQQQNGITVYQNPVPQGATEIENSEDEEEQKSEPISAKYGGIGFNIGALLFYPTEINDMLHDIYSQMKENAQDNGYYIINEIGEPSLFMATSIKIKGIIYFIPYIGIEPYAQFRWGPKMLKITGYSQSANLNLLMFDGGVNFWARFAPRKRVTFKMGMGGFGGYNIISITGDLGEVTQQGAMFGGNLCAGLDITFRKMAINLDFTVPACVMNHGERSGSLRVDGPSSYVSYNKYPEQTFFVGFEFRPGVTFKF